MLNTDTWTGYPGRHAFRVAAAATLVTALACLGVLLWGLGRAVWHPAGTGTVQGWFVALWDNLVVDRTRWAFAASLLLLLLTGPAYGYVYGVAVAPVLYRAAALRERPWLCGALYALLVWPLTLFVAFPLAGAGILGSQLAGGGMPWLALAAHVLHGGLVASWLRLTEA
ncbi:MAG: hypothetical protein QN124_05115 [Armatimonadota bacterium]|nr:hypothetical protein [Armatimonadota bacterium]